MAIVILYYFCLITCGFKLRVNIFGWYAYINKIMHIHVSLFIIKENESQILMFTNREKNMIISKPFVIKIILRIVGKLL